MKKSRVVGVAFLVFVGIVMMGCATGTMKDKGSTDDAAVTLPSGGDTSVTPPGSDVGVTPPASDGAFWAQPDAALQPDTLPPPGQDSGSPPKQDSGTVAPPALTSKKVAAIQYASGQAAQVNPACSSDPMPDVCALKGLIGQAVGKKASYVVLPEYAIDQDGYEPLPAIGENPANDGWPADWVLTILSTLAQQKNIYLVVNLITHSPTSATCTVDSDCSGVGYCTNSGVCTYLYNTSVAMDNTGKVVGRHRKFNLYGGETSALTAGKTVTEGVFQTPLGKMGMLISDDIYGSTSLNSQLASLVDVALLSSYWTTSNPVNTYCKSYLGKWPYYSVIANTTDAPGYGGGVFKGSPWAPVSTSDTPNPQVSAKPSIVVAPLP